MRFELRISERAGPRHGEGFVAREGFFYHRWGNVRGRRPGETSGLALVFVSWRPEKTARYDLWSAVGELSSSRLVADTYIVRKIWIIISLVLGRGNGHEELVVRDKAGRRE